MLQSMNTLKQIAKKLAGRHFHFLLKKSAICQQLKSYLRLSTCFLVNKLHAFLSLWETTGSNHLQQKAKKESAASSRRTTLHRLKKSCLILTTI